MKPGVAAAPDGGQQPEDEAEQPPPRRHPGAEQQSAPTQHQPRARADSERDEAGHDDPEEDEEDRARPLARVHLPLSGPLHLSRRDR